MNKKTFSLLCLLAPAALFAQNIDQARNSVDADLREAIEQLAELREEIKDEKIPLSKQLNELRAEVNQKRREVERIQRLRDNKTVDLNRLRDSVQARADELDYLANLISEYGTSFRVRMNLSETQLYAEAIDEFSAAADNASLSKTERLLEQLPLIGSGLDRVERLFGGDSFEGRAVMPSGELQNGTFVILGPSAFFAVPDTEAPAGLALNAGGLDPAVYPLGEPFEDMIREVAATGEGRLPLDSTLGDALAVKREETTLWEHIQQGGIWIWPILFFAFLATVTALYKVFEIYSVKMPKPGTLHEVLKRLNAGQDAEALEYAKTVPGPVGKMLVDAVSHADESKELVEEVMYERMLEVQPRLERLLPFIAVTAATAPLMGLLGTVTGMIKTFKLITIFGTGDAKSLASGISEALVTTEFGLIVAIPALIMHALLTRRAQGVMANMERMAVAFVNGLNRKP